MVCNIHKSETFFIIAKYHTYIENKLKYNSENQKLNNFTQFLFLKGDETKIIFFEELLSYKISQLFHMMTEIFHSNLEQNG